jgi:large subunit ribosomal protein L7/L12
MSGITKAQVIDYLSALTPDELQDLLLELEDLWGMEPIAFGPISPTMGVPIDMGIPGLRLILRDAGERPIHVMKALRELYAVSLKEAKAMVDGAGDLVLTEDLDPIDLEHTITRLREAGATVEVQ